MQLQLFKNQGFQIRGGLIDNEPYFVLADVCKILDIANTSRVANEIIDKDDLRTTEVIDNLGREQTVNIINESGLYALIFKSRKEEAKKFRKWVTSEVLPTIRKHGLYVTSQTLEEMIVNPDFTIKLLETIKSERVEKQKALALLEAQKPRVEFAERLQKSEGTLSVRDFAKVLCDKGFPVGQNRLFDILRDKGFLDRSNKPYQHYVDMGIFTLKEATYPNPSTNDDIIYIQVRITAKGQEYLYQKLNDKAA
jgi:anti-repressor protein